MYIYVCMNFNVSMYITIKHMNFNECMALLVLASVPLHYISSCYWCKAPFRVGFDRWCRRPSDSLRGSSLEVLLPPVPLAQLLALLRRLFSAEPSH